MTVLLRMKFVRKAVIAAVAPWVAGFYDTPELRPILLCLSLTFVFVGFNNVNTIATHRERP